MPLDSSSSNVPMSGTGLLEAVLARLPKPVADSLTETQLEALSKACDALKWGKHPIDIRLSIPTFTNRYFMVILGGKEQRDKARRQLEKKRHPLHTICNYLFLAGVIALGIYLVVFIETLLFITHFPTS